MSRNFSTIMSEPIAYTMMLLAEIDSMATWGKALCVPIANGSWNDPWHGSAFGRQSSATTNCLMEYSVGTGSGDGPHNANSGSGFWETSGSGLILYGGSRNFSNQCNFFKDGKLFSTVTWGIGPGATSGPQAATWTNRQPIEVLNNSHSSSSEGMTGRCPFAAIWGRELSQFEHAQLAVDPYCFLRFDIMSLFGGNTAAAPAGDVIFSGLQQIEQGVVAQTAAGMGGVLIQ